MPTSHSPWCLRNRSDVTWRNREPWSWLCSQWSYANQWECRRPKIARKNISCQHTSQYDEHVTWELTTEIIIATPFSTSSCSTPISGYTTSQSSDILSSESWAFVVYGLSQLAAHVINKGQNVFRHSLVFEARVALGKGRLETLYLGWRQLGRGSATTVRSTILSADFCKVSEQILVDNSK